MLRRVKTDPRIIADLPDKIEMRQLCNLTTEQASLYQAVVDDMLEQDRGSGRHRPQGPRARDDLQAQAGLQPPGPLPRRRLAASPGRSGKLARLEEMLEEVLAEGDKALCFTQFTELGSDARAATCRPLRPRGAVPARRHAASRPATAWSSASRQTNGPSLFLLSLKAGGTGLNLTAANHVFHFDRWWNPAVEDQATDRAFRIGQRRNVQVHKFVCVGTLEERIDAMIEEKRALAQLVVGAGESWLTELSTSQLRDLLTLSGEAIGE